MMFSVISQLASLLFFQLGTSVNTAEPTFKDYIIPGSVGLILIIVFASYWLIYKRKHVNK